EAVLHTEPFVRFAFQPVHTLDIVGGSKSSGHERLCFAPSEDSRTMCTRQHARFDPDRAYGFEVPLIRAFALIQNLVTEDSLFQPIKEPLDHCELLIV